MSKVSRRTALIVIGPLLESLPLYALLSDRVGSVATARIARIARIARMFFPFLFHLRAMSGHQ